MFNKNKNEMLVEEYQYRAVITYLPNKNGYKASVQRRTGLNEWTKIRCGLKGMVFQRKKDAESKARQQIRIQKSLDDRDNSPMSYIIYDD
jgi:hypothetical protein